ncbi:MAG TPA: hypothetical protein VGF98_04385 [Candidatus Tumulicola sp.]
MMLRPDARAAIALALAFTAGCSGTPGTPNGSVVGSGGGPVTPPTALVNVSVAVTVAGNNGASPGYVSSKTESLSIGLASVNGGPVSGAGTSTITTSIKSPGCKLRGKQLVCTGNVSGSPGTDVFSVTTYDGPNATGDVLSVGTMQASIGSGGGKLSISEQNSGQIDGIVAKLKLALAEKNGKRGKALTVPVALNAYDAAGAMISGKTPYAYPIALTIEGDATGAYSLHAGSQSGESAQLEDPAQPITLRYNGDTNASSITLQASVSAPQPVSATAPFNLRGNPPPPPVGTIYALNLGSNDGQGATVTEYSGKAGGNAAPERTLQLDAKLYARSIAVDATGDLYVGYFDTTIGFNPSNGSPDQKNVVAMYAPGASGSARPTATLTADSSSKTSLFPLYMTFDTAGGLVTYGATDVDANTGDAALTYAPGATGAATPQSAWNFSSPLLSYAGPTGLALDAAGSFYVAGALKTSLGPQYGVFVNLASNGNNPQANPSRTIPWDTKTELTPGDTTNVGLDSSGEILVANSLVTFGSGSTPTCQGRANVYAAGASGGDTDVQPLRIVTFQGIVTQNEACVSPRSPLQPFYPSIAVYGANVYAADDFNNQLAAYPDGHNGTIKPSLTISGSATGLNAPIAIVISSLSGSAPAKPVTGVSRAPAHSTSSASRTR